MTLYIIKQNGVECHAQLQLDDYGNSTEKYQLVLDEDGNPIPSSVCICNAFEPNECICGAWDDVDADSWYDDDDCV